jgi:hypothetical protein
MRALLIASTLIFSGCLSNDVLMSTSVAHQNVDRISQLQIGMTQEEVYQIMRYPTSEDQITTDDGCYDIWFYITKANVLGQGRPVARNLTPLIFKNGIFIGMGNDYYNKLFKKSKGPSLAPAATQPPAGPAEPENIDLEKNLTTPPTAPGATPTAKPSKKQVPQPETPPVQLPPEPETTPTPKPAPVKPAKPSKNARPTGPLSMSSKPKTPEPPQNPPANAKTDEDSSEPRLNEDDRQMLELEQEENFNDW